jgi:hypothetical protein
MRICFRKLRSSKAQVELIGLIIIVIIVISAMLLFLVYKMNQPEQNVKRGFVNPRLANGFLITITKVSVSECPQFSLADLITDCANDLSKEIMCDGENSCVVANRTLYSILNTSMEDLGKEFNFSIDPLATTGISYPGCEGKDAVYGEQTFTLSSGETATLRLFVCNIK